MSKRVLVLGNSIHPLLFRPSFHWRALLKDVEADAINVPTARRPPPLERYSHIILTGSEASILASMPWFDREAAWVREIAERGIPLLGSCFGHQMLVHALSGPEHVRKSTPPEIGWAEVRMIEEDALFSNVPNPWSTFVYHFDEVAAPPFPWRVLGETDTCPTHVLRYGDRPIWGLQAHPEISSRQARFFLRATILLGLKPAKHVVRALRNAPPPNDVAQEIVRNFLSMGPYDS
jgi:GMP synthase (glutamine-hydrolysing)